MAPRRSGRRGAPAYKKGDYVEYSYKGTTVTGKLFKKSPNGTDARPIWVVTPTDRRRKNEEIPERALGKVIGEQEALSNRGIKPRKPGSRASPTSVATSNSGSDDSLDQPQAPKRSSGRGSPSASNKKRKSGEFEVNSGNERAHKKRKTVTFNGAAASKKKKNAKNVARSTRYGTRSSGGSSEAVLLPELPARKKNAPKPKKVKKDENVKVVRMLTGTLYLYRGDRPRAEFVRFK